MIRCRWSIAPPLHGTPQPHAKRIVSAPSTTPCTSLESLPCPRLLLPLCTQAWLTLGHVYWKKEKLEEALNCFRSAEELVRVCVLGGGAGVRRSTHVSKHPPPPKLPL